DPFNVTEDADLGTRLRAEPVPLPGARLDNLRGGAAAAIILVPATHALDQGLYADLVLYADFFHAYAAAGEAVARARGGRVPGLPSHDRRHGAVGAGASLVLCACRLRPRTWRLPGLASRIARPAVLAHLLARAWVGLSRFDDAWLLGAEASRRAGAAQPSAADAGLLVASLRRGLSRRLAVCDRPLHLGEDRARACHGTKRAATPSPHAMLQRRLKPAKRERAVTARARGQ